MLCRKEPSPLSALFLSAPAAAHDVAVRLLALLAGPKTLSHDVNAMISTKNKGNYDSVVSSEKECKNCFVEFDECAYIKASEDEDKPTMSLSECNIVVEISPLMWKTLTLIFLY